MKILRPKNPLFLQSGKKGFTLVITLTLMILLTVIAVGLLTLSSVSLRVSRQGEAMVIARANARLALTLAIGELQKSIGPDMRVTAPSEILTASPVAKPRLMGVWNSWDFKPNDSGLDYATPKEQKPGFIGWLASDKNIEAPLARNYATAEPIGETIQLAGPKSLDAKQANPADVVRVGKVPLFKDGKDIGAYAWHVSDESFKARINAYRDPSQNQTLADKRALLAGHRPSTSFVKSADGSDLSFLPSDENLAQFEDASDVSGKLLTLGQVDLLSGSKQIGKFRNSVTLYSTGLPVNVREGGLKQDLSTAFGYSSTAMPPEYNAKKLYASTHNITGTSDPYWSALKSYYDVYLERSINTNTPVYNKAPDRDSAITMRQAAPPKKFYAAPVIAKVEILFSLVVRDSHGPWSPASTGLSANTRMIHLLYAPIITLHNPYNISLSFDQIDMDFKGIPIAFNFTVNGNPQNNELVSLNELFVVGADRLEKSFYLSISNWSDPTSTAPSPIVMKPGQNLVCGPYINGNAIFGNAGHEGALSFFDYSNNLTGNAANRAKYKPGFLGRQVSYDVDWLTLGEHSAGCISTDGGRGTLIVRPQDRFFVEWKAKANTQNNSDKMTATAKLTVGRATMDYGGLEFDYDAGNRALTKMFPTTHRYPDVRSLPNTLLVEDLYHGNLTPIRTHTKVKSFALVSAYARTTNGGVYDHKTRDLLPRGLNVLNDGRLAGRPFLHHNPTVNPTIIDLGRDIPGYFPYEFNMQPLSGSVDDMFDIGADNRGYGLMANSSKQRRGIKSGSYLELPTGPMQTIADFRRSNALTSVLLPHFVQPVANSYSSPLIETSSVSQTGIARYPLLDHSVLANHALYDRFYFSTFATFNGRNADAVFKEFMSGTKPLLSQVYEPYLPEGKTLENAQAELFTSSRPITTAYQKVAQYQMIRGAFNVNSTDVQAWKAVLSSMSDSMVQTLWANSALLSEETKTIPILPMSLVNGGAVGDVADTARIDNQASNDWNGYRNLTPYQLDLLAESIVAEVRKRGPFLSMSEFVNRRIGPESELTKVGALQAAIDESKINDDLLKDNVTEILLKDVSDPVLYKFNNPSADAGNPAAGAPGWLMQGDLMRILEPAATVRGDTFVIRVCGEAHDLQGQVTARVYAEALVQRFPEYVNSQNSPDINVWDVTAANVASDNIAFGRRLKMVSFRWLAEFEI